MSSSDSTPGTLPRHVAIIMDGNGRWAKNRKLPRPFGHREGVKALRRVVQHGIDRGLDAMTLFAFSSENWRRPALEVKLLMELFSVVLRSEMKRLMDNNARLRFVGDRTPFSPRLREAMIQAEETTGRNTGMTVVIAANYGGRWDIANAARELAVEVAAGRLRPEDIDAGLIQRHISLADLPEPDLFIRTGGEERISNFLLWQMAYTEFYFTDCLWPDFDEAALDAAFDSFGRRQRRFGRTGDQVEQRGA
ncbi:MAG: di-trans,poly-cis-decaprenylcistransferase [Lysobacterales bacterium]|nr:MAG: di-trans,poly-cis-decaprenylcistransferase [Xanthomonadales bacterium]